MGGSPSSERRREQASGPITEYLWKIVVVGEIGSGKTAIIKRLVHNMFSVNYLSTDCVDFAYKSQPLSPEAIARIQFWDISGKERYGKFTRVYYEGAVAAVVVVDLSREQFESSLAGAAMWVTDITTKVMLAPEVPLPVILLGNKMDTLSEEELAIAKARLDAFARKQGLYGWWTVSAKDDINIATPFHTLLGKIMRLSEAAPFIQQTRVIPIATSEAGASQ